MTVRNPRENAFKKDNLNTSLFKAFPLKAVSFHIQNPSLKYAYT